MIGDLGLEHPFDHEPQRRDAERLLQRWLLQPHPATPDPRGWWHPREENKTASLLLVERGGLEIHARTAYSRHRQVAEDDVEPLACVQKLERLLAVIDADQLILVI